MQPPLEPTSAFSLGAPVRVKYGTPSDYPDIPMGGWAGTIREIDLASAPPSYLVEFSQFTLDQIHPAYRKRCLRDGFVSDKTWIEGHRIEPDVGELVAIEQPTRIESRPWENNEDDWIRQRLGLTPDDPIRGQGGHSYTAFQEHFYMVTEAKTQEVVGATFPLISNWVRLRGRIEIGVLGDGTIAARVTDSDRVLFEDTKSKTLADALNALEGALERHQTVQAIPEKGTHCLLRDISGQPFRPATFDPAWRTDTVLSLARQMHETRNYSAMVILADALQDAGCDSAEILNHCRGTGPHVRGCWVVDLILGK